MQRIAEEVTKGLCNKYPAIGERHLDTISAWRPIYMRIATNCYQFVSSKLSCLAMNVTGLAYLILLRTILTRGIELLPLIRPIF